MTEKQNSSECTIICWGIATIVGIVAIAMLWMLAGFDGNQAVFTGALIGFVLGVILSLFVCRGQTAAADLASDEKPAQRYAREAEERMSARRASAAAPAAGVAASDAGAAPEPSHTETQGESAPTSSATAAASAPAQVVSGGVQPSKPLPGQAELAGKKGDWKYEGYKGAEVDQSKAVPAGETAAPAVAPAESAANAEESAPKLYDAAPAEGADDLKLISGVGPKLEQTLNDLGIYRFEQVADWGPSEIAWVDARLRFKGRIERDDWMSQAKTLAAGGETEFSAKKKK